MPSPDFKALTYPVLVADIGGTNARFALLTDRHADPRPFDSVEVAEYPGLYEAIDAAVLVRTSHLPRSMVLAIAAPVAGDSIHITNSPWVIEPKVLMQQIGLEDVIVFNDFEALAIALPALEERDLDKIGGGAIAGDFAKTVLGPGTGLGAAALIHAANTWIPIPGEGGHVELGPVTEDDFEFWRHLERFQGRVSAEWLLSGPGLVRLYRTTAAAAGETPAPLSPAEVTEAAAAGDGLAMAAVERFCRYLGRVAGDQALNFMARGGVYIAGGIAPRIGRFLKAGGFREAFEAKAPHQAIMRSIPTFLVRHERPALMGLAAYARTPLRFGIDLSGRWWRAN